MLLRRTLWWRGKDGPIWHVYRHRLPKLMEERTAYNEGTRCSEERQSGLRASVDLQHDRSCRSYVPALPYSWLFGRSDPSFGTPHQCYAAELEPWSCYPVLLALLGELDGRD